MSELKPCPFCGRQPKLIERPDSIDGFVCAVSCFCGGYSASAHKLAKRKTQAEATAKAITAWNNRPDNWISVEEKLPTVDPRYGDIDVLVHMDDGFIASATYDKNNGWELWAESGEVTHWQPLPEPPKGRKEVSK